MISDTKIFGLDLIYILLNIMFLFIPAIPVIIFRNKVFAIIFGSLCFWIISVVLCDYIMATDVGYNSIAPALYLVFGWLFGGFYCSIWLGIVLIFRNLKKHN